MQLWSNSDRRVGNDPDAVIKEETDDDDLIPYDVSATAATAARGDSEHDEDRPRLPPPPLKEATYVDCPECYSKNILGNWYCDHCSAILPTEYEDPEREQTARENLTKAAQFYATRF